MKKETIKEIVDQIINHGHEGEYLIIDGESWRIEPEPIGGSFVFKIPEYDGFVENMKEDLMLDLMHLISVWEAKAPARDRASKMNETLRKNNPGHYKKAGRKRWNKIKKNIKIYP